MVKNFPKTAEKKPFVVSNESYYIDKHFLNGQFFGYIQIDHGHSGYHASFWRPSFSDPDGKNPEPGGSYVSISDMNEYYDNLDTCWNAARIKVLKLMHEHHEKESSP